MNPDLHSPSSSSASRPTKSATKEPASYVHMLPPLPFPENRLEPFICAATLETHHGKHHRAYIDTLNKLIAGTSFRQMPLEKIIQATADRRSDSQVYNSAAQAWNHSFYWQSLRPPGPTDMPENLRRAIDETFGSVQALKQELAAVATQTFGSGWAWLVKARSRLRVIATSNAETPVGTPLVPLLTIDIWEHAYYLDYRDRRTEYVEAVLEHLLNWNFADQNLRRCPQHLALK